MKHVKKYLLLSLMCFPAFLTSMGNSGDTAWAETDKVVRTFLTSAANLTVFAFSQLNPGKTDPQVIKLSPDINIRATQKWSTLGDETSDYDFSIIKTYYVHNILYIGGGTASVIFKKDFSTIKEFEDMATRDADGKLVPHDYIVPGAYRGSLANPKFRRYIIDYCKLQIDGGVDGLFLDEVSAGFSGGRVHNFNGNEGFDDYAIADFNKYLMEKYPAYTAKDWKHAFRMTDDNIIKKDVPYNDLGDNFNYRTYLRAHGWDGSAFNNGPLSNANPLAGEWGAVTSNRMYVENENSFTGTYLKLYWGEIVTRLRNYAKTIYNKDILITSNGLFPFVDFNSLGLYTYNPDEATADYKGSDYVPVKNCHLNGTKSLMALYKKINGLSRRISGDVPLVIFIDWPTEMMTNYYKLPLSEKIDFWQIYGAEAYAGGIFPAFHLKTTMNGDPTARSSGVLDFFKTYVRFFKDNKELYHGIEYMPEKIEINKTNISQNLMFQKAGSRYILHLINHNYNRRIIPQRNLAVTVSLDKAPAAIYMVSPDFTGIKRPAFTYNDNTLTLTVDELTYYDVIVWE